MSFASHSELIGRHAFLSASKYHWINYDNEKLDEVFRNSQMARRGTELHELAHQLIRLGIKLPRSQQTLNMYVNDAIGFRMTPEQILYYSDNAYGTTDAIAFRKNFLRIHDLKTGVNDASPHQLEIYAALFCLEYAVKPGDIDIELRIYQNDEMEVHTPDVEDIIKIMSKIVVFDRRIEILKTEG
jgi:hypothetical protein